MSNLRSKQWKAVKYVEMEQENWSFFDIIDIDIADPQVIIFLLGVCGVCVIESFPTKHGKIKTVGKFRKEIIDNIQRMIFISDAFFSSHEVQLLTSRGKKSILRREIAAKCGKVLLKFWS